MRKPIPQILASLLSLAAIASATVPAIGQELVDELIEAPEIRRYSVEVIVFKYAQEVSTGSEVFIPDELPEELELEELAFEEELEVLEEPTPEAQEEPEEEPEPLPDTELVLLLEEEYQMSDALEHLTRLDVYEPIMHFGWTQATWPEEETEAIPLQRFAEPPEGLDGNLTLYLSRYLHLVVDLQLAAPPEVVTMSPDEIELHSDTTTVGQLLGYADGVQQEQPVHFQIQENRILKNGELRYYDHPKFGVLAMVTRIEEEEEEPDDVGELLGYGPE